MSSSIHSLNDDDKTIRFVFEQIRFCKSVQHIEGLILQIHIQELGKIIEIFLNK